MVRIRQKADTCAKRATLRPLLPADTNLIQLRLLLHHQAHRDPRLQQHPGELSAEQPMGEERLGKAHEIVDRGVGPSRRAPLSGMGLYLLCPCRSVFGDVGSNTGGRGC